MGVTVKKASPPTALTSPLRGNQEDRVPAEAEAAERGRTTATSLDLEAVEAMG
jgi:hypothetical protein